MKLKARIHFMIDMQLRHKVKHLLIQVLMILCATLALYGFYIYERTHYNEKKTRELLNSDIEDTYILDITSFENPTHYDKELGYLVLGDAGHYYDAVKDTEGMDYFGFFDPYNQWPIEHLLKNYQSGEEHWMEQLCEIGVKNSTVLSDIEGIDELTLCSDMLPMHTLKMSDGTYLTKEVVDSVGDGYDVVLVLGSGYSGLKTGIELKNESRDIKYYVYGILDENQLWPEHKIACANLATDMTCPFYDLTYAIVSIGTRNRTEGKNFGKGVDYPVFFAVSEGYDKEEVFKALEKEAEKNNVTISISSLRASFDVRNRENAKINKIIKELVWTLLITTILVSICIQVVNTLDSRKIYGILYANGAGKKDMLLMNIYENVLRIVVALLAGLAFMAYITRKLYVETTTDVIMNNDLLYRYSMPKCLLLLAAVALVSSVIPYIITKKTMPSDMIGGKV